MHWEVVYVCICIRKLLFPFFKRAKIGQQWCNFRLYYVETHALLWVGWKEFLVKTYVLWLCWRLLLCTVEREVGSLRVFCHQHTLRMFLITCCLKAPGNFAAWIQGLYAVLLFPLVVGRAPYSCRGKHSLSSFYSNGQYANEVVKNGWNTKAVWMHLHKL